MRDFTVCFLSVCILLCEKDKQAVQRLEAKVRAERQSCGEKVKGKEKNYIPP